MFFKIEYKVDSSYFLRSIPVLCNLTGNCAEEPELVEVDKLVGLEFVPELGALVGLGWFPGVGAGGFCETFWETGIVTLII